MHYDDTPSCEYVSTAAAAELTGKSARTMRNRCLDHGVGIKVDGDWQVSLPGLRMLEANDTGSLDAYTRGDRKSERITAYFHRLRIPLA